MTIKSLRPRPNIQAKADTQCFPFLVSFLVPSFTERGPSSVFLFPSPRSQLQVSPPNHRKSSSSVSRRHEIRILVLPEISRCPQAHRTFPVFSQCWFSAPFSLLGLNGFPFVSFTLSWAFRIRWWCSVWHTRGFVATGLSDALVFMLLEPEAGLVIL